MLTANFLLSFLVFSVPSCGNPSNTGSHLIKRQSSELRDAYDFVIVGGGTAGLTVADRLTEAFPKSKSHT